MTGWRSTLLGVAVALYGCSKGDDRSAKHRPAPHDHAGDQAVPQTAAHLPTSRSVASSIAGKRLRAWISSGVATQVTAAEALPAPVAAELTELLAATAPSRPQIRWAAAQAETGKPGRGVAIAYHYTTPGNTATLGFAVAADRQQMYVLNQAVELAEADFEVEIGQVRDTDGDGISDLVVSYHQRANPPTPPSDAGLIVLGSRPATAMVIPLFRRRSGKDTTEQMQTWGGCWATIAGHPVLLLVHREETLVRMEGEEKPLRSKYVAAIYSPDEEGKLVATTLYAGVLGSANTLPPLIDEWRDWIGDPRAEVPVAPEQAVTWDVATCPAKTQLALIVPARSSRPSGGDGYHLLAWPALNKNVTIDGVSQARLPVSAVVELGVTDNLR